MKKRIIICLYIIAFLVLAKLLFTYFYNESLNKKYESGDYNSFYDLLTYLNYPEPYKAYYNNANVYYRRADYGRAADLYRKALESKPKHKDEEMDECLVRINLALSMAYGLGDDYAIPEKREESISVLKEAVGILVENGCATDNDDGHSVKAQKLKNELEKLIEELENMDKQQEGGGSGQDQGQSGGGNQSGSGSGSGGGDENGNSGGEENGDNQSDGNSGQDKQDGSGSGDEDSNNENGGGDDGNQGDDSGDNGDGQEGDKGANDDKDSENGEGSDKEDNKGDKGDDDDETDNGNDGGAMSPEDKAEEDMRGKLMDQQEKNNREREESMGSLEEWTNWEINDGDDYW